MRCVVLLDVLAAADRARQAREERPMQGKTQTMSFNFYHLSYCIASSV